MRAHTAYGRFLQLVAATGPAPSASSGRPSGAPSRAGRTTLGRFLLDDGRPDEARGYLQLAADDGDNSAARRR